MSAWICSDRHIAALIGAGFVYARHGALKWRATDEVPDTAYQAGSPWGPGLSQIVWRELTTETAERTGAMLVAENRRSVNHRYAESEIETIFQYDHRTATADARKLGPVALLKLVNCYEYQSCETPEWPQSEAFRFCETLRATLVHSLPGYEDAPWGLR